VSDEVINGFGRVGSPFGCRHYGFTPDIMVLSKQLTSSYVPLAAVLFSEQIYAAVADNSARIGTFGHGFTTSGHPLAMAIALENLRIIDERDLMGQAARVGAFMQRELAKLASHPLVGEVRGSGLIAGLELVEDKSTRRPFDPQLKVGSKVFAVGHEHGLIVRAIGDTIALCPPMIITEAQVQEVIARLKRTLDQTAAQLAADGRLQQRYA
jgi:4-aminobutyrate--pyruvate transaminase